MRLALNASLLSLLLLADAAYALAAPEDLAVQQYRAVGAKLWCGESNPVACYNADAHPSQPAPRPVEENTTRLRNLITRAITAALTSPAASEQTIARVIESIQRGDENTSVILGEEPAFVEFGRAGNIRVLVVGFSIYRGGRAIPDTRPYMQFYAHESGSWILKGEVGLELRGCFWSHLQVKGRGNSKLLYWLSGTRYGDTGSRLRVQLFEFDGSEVRPLWQREGLVRGQLTVAGDRFSIEYDLCPPGQNWGCSRALESWIVNEAGQVLRLSDARSRKK